MASGTTSSLDDVDIPVVDLSSPDAATELLNAARKHGFIFVKPSDIGPSSRNVADMFALSREFFSSPKEVKAECTINSSTSGANRGWLPMHKETLDPANQKRGDFKEAFNLGEFVDGKAQQPLPKPLKASEDRMAKFGDDCYAFCNRILDLLAIALELDSRCRRRITMVLNAPRQGKRTVRKYPAPALYSMAYNPSEDIRAGAHSDYGSITLLFRLPSQPGLQILTPAGTWASVPVNPDSRSGSEDLPILVNIGDLLSYWTNGLLKSTVHRVIFPTPGDGPKGREDRYSMAYFCHPEDAAELVEVPSEVVRQHGRGATTALSKPDSVLTARDHLNERLAATYGAT